MAPCISRVRLRELFDYDYLSGSLIWKSNNRNGSHGEIAGTAGNRGYTIIGIKGKTYVAHRIVWAWHYDEWLSSLDHINMIKHDNRIENLRPCTAFQNQGNRLHGKNSSSLARGVCWRPDRNTWRVRLYINKKAVNIGSFVNKDEAIIAHALAAKKYFGEFART